MACGDSSNNEAVRPMAASEDLLEAMLSSNEDMHSHAHELIQSLDNLKSTESVTVMLKALSDRGPLKRFIHFMQVICEMGLNKIVDHLLKNDHPSENSYMYILLNSLLTLCARNTASASYLYSRRKEIFPRLLLGVDSDPLKPRVKTAPVTILNRCALYLFAFALVNKCLYSDTSASLAAELIDNYNILNHIADALRLDGTEKYFQDRMFSHAIGLTSALASLGGDICRQQVKTHGCYRLICSHLCTAECKTERGRHGNLIKTLHDAVAGRETDMDSLEPYQRLSLRDGCQYYVFCSSPACQRMVRKDGILRRCARCKLAHYCNRECQVHHWQTWHKRHCIGKQTKSK